MSDYKTLHKKIDYFGKKYKNHTDKELFDKKHKISYFKDKCKHCPKYNGKKGNIITDMQRGYKVCENCGIIVKGKILVDY